MANARQYTVFGLAIKRALLERRITQKKFCEKEGIPVNRLTEMIYGLRPGIKYRQRIIEALGLDDEVHKHSKGDS
jgi:predicted transcriptional regulator